MTEHAIKIQVLGLPPKKDGANSLWRKGTEVPRLKALRAAAVTAMGNRPPFTVPLAITLRIYALPHHGDLDNFITGVCDSLMAAHPRTPIDTADWDDLPEAARPSHHIVYRDDQYISKITAERLPPPGDGTSYEIEILPL